MDELEFRWSSFEHGTAAVEPVVSGVLLCDRVREFEKSFAGKLAGHYAGLVFDHFNVGDLPGYFEGRESDRWPKHGRVWVLGCECGEVGCWPLECSVTVDAATVTWSDFAQPHRPEWDYDGFGPYTFDVAAYRRAVGELVAVRGNG